jgi:hypothetical protein
MGKGGPVGMEIDARSPDGNAFAIMGYVSRLLKAAGREDELPAVMERMRSGDYRNLCAVAEEVTFGSIKVVNLDGEDDGDDDDDEDWY